MCTIVVCAMTGGPRLRRLEDRDAVKATRDVMQTQG